MGNADIPRLSLFLIGFALGAAILGSLVISGHFPDQAYFLLVVPILYAAFYYPRWVYLSLLLVSVILAVTAILYRSEHVGSSLQTTVFFVVAITLTGELIQKITARCNRTEQVLRESEERYRSLVEHSQDLIWRVDRGGRFTFINPVAKHVLGYEPGELIGETCEKVLMPASVQEAKTSLARRLASELGREGIVIELTVRRKDGTSFIAETRSSPIIGPAGELVEIQGISRDITEHKKAQEAERELHHQLKVLHEVSNELSKASSFDELCQRAVELGHERLGFDRFSLWFIDETNPQFLAGSFGIDETGQVRDERGIRARVLENSTVCQVRTDRIDTILLEDRPLFNHKHEQVGQGSVAVAGIWDGKQYIGFAFTDNLLSKKPITRQGQELLSLYAATVGHLCSLKLAEEQLRDSRQRLQAIFDSAADAIFTKDTECRYSSVNRACCEMYGLPKSEIIGKTDAEFFSPENARHIQETDERALRGEIIREEYTARVHDKTYTVHITKVPLYDSKGKVFGLCGIARDITEQKKAERERRRLEDRMRHAQKLESLGVLAGGIAHDFSNLLMGILGNVSLALMDLPSDSPIRENLEQIDQAGRRAAELCKQMVAYSGKGRFLLQPIDLSEIIREMSQLLQVCVSKNVTLTYDFQAGIPAIEGDPTQIRQVVMNLITNASEAIGEKTGTIRVSTGVMECDSSYLAETYMNDDLPAGRYAYVEVADTGCGMDAQTEARIFDPFFTTKFTGRGLGLAAVLGIVRGHRGAIKVHSVPNHGTTFRVLFPRSDKPVTTPERSEPKTEGWRGTGTILVVDDEECVRDVVRRMLEASGFSVLTAVDGQNGVELFQRHCGDIAAVLLDMTMPGMSGKETLRRLQQIRPDVKVILSSGYNEQEAIAQFAGKGLAAFIQKPYRAKDLVHKLKWVLEH